MWQPFVVIEYIAWDGKETYMSLPLPNDFKTPLRVKLHWHKDSMPVMTVWERDGDKQWEAPT